MIAVTGSTGRLGGRVARNLFEAGLAQRLIVRDPDRAPDYPAVEVYPSTFTDLDRLVPALRGVEAVFMVSAHEGPGRVAEHRAFLDAVAAAGSPPVVYTSFMAAAPDAVFTLARDHWHTEQYARELNLSFTFLRDNLYADAIRALVGPDDVIRGPAGDGAVSAVARHDVADVATAILRDPGPHAGATYQLTGPEAMTFTEIAALVSRLIGRTVSYRDETLAEAHASRAHYAAEPWQVEAWVSTYTAIASGAMATVSTDVADLTGRPATSIESLLRRRYGSPASAG